MPYSAYNGTSGLFVSAEPSELFSIDICKLRAEFPETITSDPTCTLMYSKEKAGDPNLVRKVYKNCPRRIKALITSVYTKTDGCFAFVCANLVSKRLHMLNAYLIRCGAEHNQIPFEPHIVLWKHDMLGEGDHFFNARNFGMSEKLDEINKRLAHKPMFVEFHLTKPLNVSPS